MGQLLNEAELSGVDERMVAIVKAAAAALPYDVEIRDGSRKGGKGNHKHGYAVDVAIIGENGKALPNKMYQNGKLIPGAIEAFPIYERFAQTARVAQKESYPELNNVFRWGGGFRQGGTPFDMMHLDITPNAKGAMAYYNWDKGLTSAALADRPELKGMSNGGLGGTNGSRLVAQYSQSLAGGPIPPGFMPEVASLTDTASALAPVPQRKSAALDAITSATGGRVASPGIPSAYDSPRTPQQVASLYEGIYPPKREASLIDTLTGGASGQSPQLFGDTVGTPDSMIRPDDATYSGANRLGVGGIGAMLGNQAIPPALPNPTRGLPSSFPDRPGVIPSNGRPSPSVGGVGGAGIAGQAQLPRNVVPGSVQRDMAAINALPQIPMPMSSRDGIGAMPSALELLAMGMGTKAPIPMPTIRRQQAPQPASYARMQQARNGFQIAPMPAQRRSTPQMVYQTAQVAPVPMPRPTFYDRIERTEGNHSSAQPTGYSLV
jgi:hypothetical protein